MLKLPPLKDHTAVLVVPPQKHHDENNLFKVAEQKNKLVYWKDTKKAGIYLFGGEKTNSQLSSDLYFVEIGVLPMVAILLKPKGDVPAPRTGCSLDFSENLNCLIVSGGMTGVELEKNNFYLFNLETFSWKRFKVVEENLLNFYNHSSVVMNNKLVIFGGISDALFSGNNLIAVALSMTVIRSGK